MEVSITDVIRAAKSGKFEPVHVLLGTEGFLIERAITALRALVTKDSAAGLNDDVFHGKQTSAQSVLSCAKTLPMFARVRFVLVRDVDGMKADDLDAFASYLESPSPSTCLVLTGEKLDKRTRFARQAEKRGWLTEAQALKARDVRGFAIAESMARGHVLEGDAADALVDAIGTDLAALDDALERLSLYAGSGAAITVHHVDACIARVRVDTIWSLVDAVGARDTRTALNAADSLLRDREPPLRVLAMVSRQLRIVAKMRTALASGLAGPEATKAAGAPPFKARELTESARRFTNAELRQAFRTLADADLALKGSKRPGDVVLEESILALCGASPKGSAATAVRERLRTLRLRPR